MCSLESCCILHCVLFVSLSGGLQVFLGFLRSEFSEENLEFWLACEDYRVSPSSLQKTKASSIYSMFINPDAPKEVCVCVIVAVNNA